MYDAFQSGSLMSTYLSKWLDDMSSELIKLEQDATPVGWLLQWDRYAIVINKITNSIQIFHHFPYHFYYFYHLLPLNYLHHSGNIYYEDATS